MGILTLITAATVEPVTVEEAKEHARVTITDDDALIYAQIVAARQRAEAITGRQMVTATWELILDRFPASGIIELAHPPLQSVTSVKYLDTDGAEQTFSSGDYEVDTDSEPGKVRLGYDKSWPNTRDIWNAVRVRYVCGYEVTTYTAATISAANSTSKVSDSESGFGDFSVHDWPSISGFTNSGNNGNFRVTAATAAALTLDATLTDEDAGQSVTISKPTTPQAIKDWIKIQVTTMYAYPEAVVTGAGNTALPIPRGFVDGLLDPYCLPSV